MSLFDKHPKPWFLEDGFGPAVFQDANGHSIGLGVVLTPEENLEFEAYIGEIGQGRELMIERPSVQAA